MDEMEFAQVYRGLLPECHCFRLENERLSDHAHSHISLAVNMGEQVAGHLMSAGICPSAMPAMLLLVLSSAATNLSMRRIRDVPAETALDIIPDFRETMEAVAAAVPGEVTRAEIVAHKMHGVSGTC